MIIDRSRTINGQVMKRLYIALFTVCCLLASCDKYDDTAVKDAIASLEERVLALEKLNGELGKLPFIVFGPFEAQVYKINEKFRMRMVVKCVLNKRSRELFSRILSKYSGASAKKPNLSIDFNPTNL